MTRRVYPIVAILVLTGCAPPEVQPKRSLRELYEVQAEVDKTADPYDLGTGAAPGRVNHERAGERAIDRAGEK